MHHETVRYPLKTRGIPGGCPFFVRLERPNWVFRCLETAMPLRRNGDAVAPERRCRCAGTGVPFRRNGGAVSPECVCDQAWTAFFLPRPTATQTQAATGTRGFVFRTVHGALGAFMRETKTRSRALDHEQGRCVPTYRKEDAPAARSRLKGGWVKSPIAPSKLSGESAGERRPRTRARMQRAEDPVAMPDRKVRNAVRHGPMGGYGGQKGRGDTKRPDLAHSATRLCANLCFFASTVAQFRFSCGDGKSRGRLHACTENATILQS